MKQIVYNYERKQAYITLSDSYYLHTINKETFSYYITHYKLEKIYDGEGYIWFKIEPTK